jgi:serine protease Do
MDSRIILSIGVAAAMAWPDEAAAQVSTRVYTAEPGRAYSFSVEDDENRAVIGITTSTGSARDTLGVLISTIAPGGPAEKAGLEEGNRIATINGVNLRLAPADIGDWDMSGVMSRRLTRELGKLKAGAEVDLRVYSGGQFRNVKLRTVTYDSLYPSMRRTRRDFDDRAVLGISLGSSGSKRDTLGVFVMGLDDEGPAAKAGIEEGNRIAAIGGVDLRVSRDDAGDELVSGVKVQRLQRELEKLKAGDEVDLRIYGDGRWRNVKVKTVAASTLSRSGNSMFLRGVSPSFSTPRIAPTPPMPAIAPRRITRVTM